MKSVWEGSACSRSHRDVTIERLHDRALETSVTVVDAGLTGTGDGGVHPGRYRRNGPDRAGSLQCGGASLPSWTQPTGTIKFRDVIRGHGGPTPTSAQHALTVFPWDLLADVRRRRPSAGDGGSIRVLRPWGQEPLASAPPYASFVALLMSGIRAANHGGIMFVNERFIDGDRPIVVGIDGSPAALRALLWGVHEAYARECPLVVVHAWGNVPLPGAMFTSANERRRASECFVANEVAAATRNLAHPPAITEVSTKGPAASVLIEHARDAALLIIGRSRNHHAAQDLMPGSVSAACVRAASCPVLVVPEFASATEELQHHRALATQEADR